MKKLFILVLTSLSFASCTSSARDDLTQELAEMVLGTFGFAAHQAIDDLEHDRPVDVSAPVGADLGFSVVVNGRRQNLNLIDLNLRGVADIFR